MARLCPDCDVNMMPRSFFGVLVDTCGTCGGIFFDEGEVSQIRARGGDRAFEELDNLIQPEPGYVHTEENMYRRCPKCTITMHRFRYMYNSPVFLDSCENCGGIWIENGELKRMKEYLQSGKTENKSGVIQERDEAIATLDALTIEQQDKARRAHWIANAMAYYPWL